ncbi:MAG: hypothetical protein BAA01_12645 [Bacillus thermozeamaize]|uniref:Sigma factor regulator C-terminal domain-containing protein n=1 Tax=Bacillus thermozeamaize TaxID=230954 RepID=A0A1Y3PT03_9BACI|nr:MAG: hypothetical protein BAA01_12645 [Bacillus thermozeamaize]
MTEEWKKRWRAYVEDRLTDEEKEQVEEELAKLEAYQEFLEEELEKGLNAKLNKKSHRNSKSSAKSDPASMKLSNALLRWAKWKARLQNTVTALAIFFLLMIFGSILTGAFYSWGEPNRMEIYQDVIRSTVAVTEPNIQFSSSGMNTTPWFTMRINAQLEKQIGDKLELVGEMSSSFLFNRMSSPERKWLIYTPRNYPLFYHPEDNLGDPFTKSTWNSLEKLPEGTVSELYLSLDHFYSTAEVLSLLEGKNLQPLWFAVDTGMEEPYRTGDYRPVDVPFGFPFFPMWHHDDMKLDELTVERKSFFSTVTIESRGSPPIEAYGSAEVREENFIKTLQLLTKYENIAKGVSRYHDLHLSERLAYIQEKGVRIYGVVVTGPTKELLKLKEEPWVRRAVLGEVRLWSWSEEMNSTSPEL